MNILKCCVIFIFALNASHCFCSEFNGNQSVKDFCQNEEYKTLEDCYKCEEYKTLCNTFLTKNLIHHLVFTKLGTYLQNTTPEEREDFFLNVAKTKIDKSVVFNQPEEEKGNFCFNVAGACITGNCPKPWVLEYRTTYLNIMFNASDFFATFSTDFISESEYRRFNTMPGIYEYTEFKSEFHKYISEKSKQLPKKAKQISDDSQKLF